MNNLYTALELQTEYGWTTVMDLFKILPREIVNKLLQHSFLLMCQCSSPNKHKHKFEITQNENSSLSNETKSQFVVC